MPNLSTQLAEFAGAGYVVAPAGFGKTHLVARSVAACEGRQLILTHTYAGVNVLRRYLREAGVSPTKAITGTIAGFALRLCNAYPNASEYTLGLPKQSLQWASLYSAATRLLAQPFIKRIVRASYAGFFVDEYQDCTAQQHALVMELAKSLPCRILGDPLQAIFAFDGQELVDWKRDVQGPLEDLGQLEIPHRWRNVGKDALGAWLMSTREELIEGRAINVSGHSGIGVNFRTLPESPKAVRTQVDVCRQCRCDGKETLVAMHGGDAQDKNRCHHLARQLSGVFASIEEVEGASLFSFLTKLERARTPSARLKAAVALAKDCMTDVASSLSQGTKDGKVAAVTPRTRYPLVTQCANEYFRSGLSAHLLSFLVALKELPGTRVFRADLLNRLFGVLRKHIADPALSLADAAEKYHAEFRHVGRPVGHRRLIATTLLVKGLQFDHAIVLNAAALSTEQLYVALTRASSSLTILAESPVLTPSRGHQFTKPNPR